MKSQITFLFLLVAIGNGYSQKCSNYSDCISHYHGTKNREDQVAYAGKAIKFAKKEGINPAKAYYFRGQANYYLISKEKKASEIKKAENDFLEAVKLDPTYYWSYSWLGSIYDYMMKDFDKCLANYNSYLNANPKAAFPYYDRAYLYQVFSKKELALADFKKAYDLILSNENTLEINDDKKSKIILIYVKYLQESKNQVVYDTEALAILESGLTLAPTDPYLLGELALAYFDNNQLEKAKETASLAIRQEKSLKSYEYKNSGASFVLGFVDFENENYRAAAFSLSPAYANRKIAHPAVSFYSAIAAHYYYATVATNLWSANINKIKKKYNEAIRLGEGTKYDYLSNNAKKQLEGINNPNGSAGESENQEHDFKQFLVNFNQMPSNYTLDYNTVQGRDISDLVMAKKYFPNGGEVDAIGLISSCEKGYVFLLMYKNERKNTTSINFLTLTTDLKGNEISSKNITTSQVDMGNTTILGRFSMHINGSDYTINSEKEYTATGHKDKETINGSCN